MVKRNSNDVKTDTVIIRFAFVKMDVVCIVIYTIYGIGTSNATDERTQFYCATRSILVMVGATYVHVDVPSCSPIVKDTGRF